MAPRALSAAVLVLGLFACKSRVPAVDPGIGASGPAKVTGPSTEQHRRSSGDVLDQGRASREAKRILAEVAAARNLEVIHDVKVDVIDRPGIREFSKNAMYEDTTPEDLRRAGRIESALGVLPVGVDPEAILLDMLEDSVLGLYDPKSKTLFIGDFVPSVMLSMVVGHEIAHGLQDMHFDLEKTRTVLPHRSDEESARRFLIEGGAQASYLAWVSGEGGLASIDDAVLEALGNQTLDMGGESSPYPILARAMGMPYADGTASIVRLVLAKGWSAVDELYEKPPETTEQMLHLDKLLNREPREDVALDEAALAQVLGLTPMWHDQIGEAALLSMLAEVEPSVTARGAAAGWGGDMLYAFDREGSPLDAPAIVAVVTWDRQDDAREFVQSFGKYLTDVVGTGTFVERQRDVVVFGTHLPEGVDPGRVAKAAFDGLKKPGRKSEGSRSSK
jgi:hypothetical protein